MAGGKLQAGAAVHRARLSISRVVPTRAASAACAPRLTGSTGASVRPVKNSTYSSRAPGRASTSAATSARRRAAELAAAAGHPPEIWRSANAGGDEANAALLARLKDRMPHL